MENIGRVCDWIEAGRPVPDDRLKKTLSYKDDNSGKQKGANTGKGVTGASALQGVSTAKGAAMAGKGGNGKAASGSKDGNGKAATRMTNLVPANKGGKSGEAGAQPNIEEFLARLLQEFRNQPY